MTKDLWQLVNLGIHLLQYQDEGVIMPNAEKSLLVVELKEKQYTDPILLQLKENVLHCVTKHLSLKLKTEYFDIKTDCGYQIKMN